MRGLNTVTEKTCTCVYAGVRGRDSKLRFDELGDKGDEGSDNSALGCVGQTHEQERHVAEDPYCSLGEICTMRNKKNKIASANTHSNNC